MKTLTPKVWRHAWANWSEDSSDPDRAALATKVMRHSPEVRRVHYLEKNRNDATRFGKAIIENVLEGKETVEAQEKRPKEKVRGEKDTEQRRVIQDDDRSLLRSVSTGRIHPQVLSKMSWMRLLNKTPSLKSCTKRS